MKEGLNPAILSLFLLKCWPNLRVSTVGRMIRNPVKQSPHPHHTIQLRIPLRKYLQKLSTKIDH